MSSAGLWLAAMVLILSSMDRPPTRQTRIPTGSVPRGVLLVRVAPACDRVVVYRGEFMGLGLVVLILAAAAAGFAAFTVSKTDSSTAMSFALVLAVAGGAVFIGAEAEARLLGVGLLLVAVFSATGALLAARTTQQDHAAR